MRQLSLSTLLICLVLTSQAVKAQDIAGENRQAEWNSYVVPATNFSRKTSADNEFLFRVPADWKQTNNQLTFVGPNSCQLRVIVDKIPDGVPLPDYMASFMRAIRDIPGARESTVLRRTRFQDLEARELVLELPNAEGETIRSVSWVTTSGPIAVTFNFQTKDAHAAELEPYFKAVIQSVMFVRQQDYKAIEDLRTEAIKPVAPGPVNEVQRIVDLLNELGSSRETAITQLVSTLASFPDGVIDLLLDRRPVVRSAAVEAIVRSKNPIFEPFLWRALEDPQAYIATSAAGALAMKSDIVAKLMDHSLSGFSTEIVARVWPFLSKEARTTIWNSIFSQTALRPDSHPPPGIRPKPGVSVSVTELTPVKPGKLPTSLPTASQDPSVQLGALTLLARTADPDSTIPFSRIVAAKYDVLTAAALEVALERGQSVPTDLLFNLLTSPSEKVQLLAAKNLAFSGAPADVARLESLMSPVTKSASSGTSKATNSQTNLAAELKLTIKKIRFRALLVEAKGSNQAQQEVIRKGLTDSEIADFVWRYSAESNKQATETKIDLQVKPLAENLFPQNVVHYAAIPNIGQSIDRFYNSLESIQMDSARSQSSLALMIGGVRQSLGQQLGAAPDNSRLIDYSGIKADSPIAFAEWTAEGAPPAAASALHKAIVLRVNNSERFQQLVEAYQKAFSSFGELPNYLGVTLRALPALPALIPLTAQAVMSAKAKKPKPESLLRYSVTGVVPVNGLQIKSIEFCKVDATGHIETAATYLAFLGDTAIITRDLSSMRDLLERASNVNRPTLAANPEFQRAVETGGDAIYFSDVKAVLSSYQDFPAAENNFKLTESGALKIEKSSWENSYRLGVNEGEWAKPLLPFHPRELAAPGELLPDATVAYFFIKADWQSLWAKWGKDVFNGRKIDSSSTTWAMDFEREVLPELGPECGFALLELPEFDSDAAPSWVAFAKLKSNKLSEALAAGKLFQNTGLAKEFVEVRSGSESYFITARSGFLVVSNQAKSLAALETKAKLAATRDYAKAAEAVPDGISAFGGYNLAAAVNAAKKDLPEGLLAERANLFFSLAGAFHSQNLFATINQGTIEAKSSVAMDREGRYAVADLTYRPHGANITYATLEARGVPIADQNRLTKLSLRIRAKTAGAVENIRDEVQSESQTVELRSPNEMILTVKSRRPSEEAKVSLPVNDATLSSFLSTTAEIPANDEQIKKQAREIAGEDHDAWSVALKLADWTHKNLEWKFVANADPMQTLATREADCSEFSELYVAMARSIGLPARIVSGLAYSGDAFGGHAWVEVWAGRWIELDPTWGTHFVDATHIRNSSTALVTYAALDKIELEVLEASRSVADFQRSPSALAEQITKTLSVEDGTALDTSIDIALLTDQLMGANAWEKMSEVEREQVSSAYRRVGAQMLLSFPKDKSGHSMRLLGVKENGDRAEATCLYGPESMLLKLHFLRHEKSWYLVEISQQDKGLQIVEETLRPVMQNIEDRRLGKKPSAFALGSVARVIQLLDNDPEKALTLVEQLLKNDSANQELRFLHALALLSTEKTEAAAAQLTELSAEQTAPPAVFLKLARIAGNPDAKIDPRTIELYKRYLAMEPFDSRAYAELGWAYESFGDLTQAEANYRKGIEIDPYSEDSYSELVRFMVVHNRLREVSAILDDAEKRLDDADVLAAAMENLEEPAQVERLAASQPARMRTSAAANLTLARTYLDDNRYLPALRLLRLAARLDKHSSAPYTTMAEAFADMARWNDALLATGTALSLDSQDALAHYYRACALVHLNRKNEAMEALTRSIELDPFRAAFIADDKDLKPLADLPAFKKLLADVKKE